jgi:hypothetical protein
MKNKLFVAFLAFNITLFFTSFSNKTMLDKHEITQKTPDLSLLESLQIIKNKILEGITMGSDLKDFMITTKQINPKTYQFELKIFNDLYNSDIYQQILTDKLNICLTHIEKILNDKNISLDNMGDFYVYAHMYFIIPLDENIKAKAYNLHKAIYTKYVTNYCNHDKNWPFKNVTFDEYLKTESTKNLQSIIFANLFNQKLLEKINAKMQEETTLYHILVIQITSLFLTFTRLFYFFIS